jgi:putative spermidine/putrescine transport system permease protein
MEPVARNRRRALALAVPALAVFAEFWLLPMARLVQVGGSGPEGIAA